jgi:competence protein ComEC
MWAVSKARHRISQRGALGVFGKVSRSSEGLTRYRQRVARPLPVLLRSLRALLLAFVLSALLASCGGTAGTQSAAVPTAKAKPAYSAKPTKKPSAKPQPAKTAAPTKASGGGSVTLAFVDVGQGDGIVIKAGSWAGLIDGGGAGHDAAIAAEFSALGISRLDALVVSHPHEDHIGDLVSIVQRYRPRVAYSDATATTACYKHLIAALHSVGAKVSHAYRGMRLHFGALVAQVLSPGTYTAADLNADSIVLLLKIDGKEVLLTGDLTGPNEAAVGSICARGPPLYLLKVAHHGSAYSSGDSFLSATRPQYAVISVGPNSYGHPSPAALARLHAHSVRTYTTQRDGTITVRFAASGSVTWSFTRSSKPVQASSGSTGSGTTSSSGSDPIVYITATGECYHRAGCRYLSKSKIAIHLSKAKAEGYRPCSVCKPPT